MRARLPAVLGLGAGVVLSLITLCCGIGGLMAPWIRCGLLAVQLGEALSEPIERSRSWFGAGAMLLGAVLLVGAVGWVTWLALMMDPVSMAGTVTEDGSGWLRLGSGGAWLAAL